MNVTLAYNGITIRGRNGKLNLTDMWRAAGADPARQPAKWRELDGTKDFVGHLTDILLQEENILFETGAGRNGATWAHWQLGIAYAKYLSPAFHAWCNSVVRERMEGKIGRPEELAVVAPAVASISKAEMGRMFGAIVDDKLARVKAEVLAEVEEQAAATNEMLLLDVAFKLAEMRRPPHHSTALKIALTCGMKKAPRGAIGRIAGALRRFQQVNPKLPEPVLSNDRWRVWLFDSYLASAWLKAGGREAIRAEKGRALGQGVMRLPPGRKSPLG
nr:KilA-N domain-containing protein [uncultured Roseococcus sp.]